MKEKLIEKTDPPKTRKKGYVTITQRIEDITVLNCFSDGTLRFRHCVRLTTGEHATWYAPGYNTSLIRSAGEGAWTTNNLLTSYGFKDYWDKNSYRYNWSNAKRNAGNTFSQKQKSDGKKIADEIRKLHAKKYWTSYSHCDWIDLLDRLEQEYDADKRATAAERKRRRINDLMELIDGTQPDKFMVWSAILSIGGMGVAVHNPSEDKWCCSECGNLNPRENFIPEPGKKVGSNKPAFCPSCGRPVRILTRRKNDMMIQFSAPISILQKINDDISVMRHFKFYTYAYPDRQKELDWHETVRLVMHKGETKNKKRYSLYYNVCRASISSYNTYYGSSRGCASWNDTNPSGQRMVSCFLYPDPDMITAALKGTDYESWTRSFIAMSGIEMKVDYNNFLAAADKSLPGITELLCKGRFYKLLSETSDRIWAYSGEYFGKEINIHGSDIHEVLGLTDTQMINRLRDTNGGHLVLDWLKWSERHRKKIPQAVLEWLIKEKIGAERPYQTKESSIFRYMSPEQAMHYIKRQQAAGYKGKSANAVIDQWEDYMAMAERIGKKISDELIYKPADLKQRHDEYVEYCEKHRRALEAKKNREHAKKMEKEMLQRFPESEKILKEIKPLFEWENDDYKIIVPKSLAEIIFEGTSLHHCAGSTDRYFDRICQHETYICFLRKKKKLKEAYYTIEVEPGGVIRQHRGMYDEEPEIEKVKPALREWQKEIKKRMKKKDKERAKESERKRVENIAYLREHIDEKNNRRVLQGLEEDLMAL